MMSADIVGPTTAEGIQRLAAAQAKRDRARLKAAQEDIADLHGKVVALNQRIANLERSPSRRLFAPARQLIRLARRLLSKPSVLVPAEQDELESTTALRGLALVIDREWPQPDRDSGSIDIVNLVHSLQQIGFRAILAASDQHAGDPARERLTSQGIECLTADHSPSVQAFIANHGSAIAVCVMCRVFCGGEFLEQLQRHARQARLVFNSIDLNYVREERKAHLLQDHALLETLAHLRAREEHVMRSSDATLVVSETERQLLAETMPDVFAIRMPLARPVRRPTAGFARRTGIGFIGGFAHTPNLDAVRYFLSDIWPNVLQALPDCQLSIVGPDAPIDLASHTNNVCVIGYLADVTSWFDSIRLTIAPLRYGAGAKGKVASSLAQGVPCVVTSVAAEGMSLADEDGVLIRDVPTDFAAAIIQVYSQEALWQRLSSCGLGYAERELSLAKWQIRLDTVVSRIGL